LFLVFRRRALRRSLFACLITCLYWGVVPGSSSQLLWLLLIDGESCGVVVFSVGSFVASDFLISALCSCSSSSALKSSSMSFSIRVANRFLLLSFCSSALSSLASWSVVKNFCSCGSILSIFWLVSAPFYYSSSACCTFHFIFSGERVEAWPGG
jgi:hypothetical protein